jgi:hypothetical protein
VPRTAADFYFNPDFFNISLTSQPGILRALSMRRASARGGAIDSDESEPDIISRSRSMNMRRKQWFNEEGGIV